jgi:hypothetical protein
MVGMPAALDTDDIGAEIGQKSGAKGTGEHVRKVQDSHSGQRRDEGRFNVGGHRRWRLFSSF